MLVSNALLANTALESNPAHPAKPAMFVLGALLLDTLSTKPLIKAMNVQLAIIALQDHPHPQPVLSALTILPLEESHRLKVV